MVDDIDRVYRAMGTAARDLERWCAPVGHNAGAGAHLLNALVALNEAWAAVCGVGDDILLAGGRLGDVEALLHAIDRAQAEARDHTEGSVRAPAIARALDRLDELLDLHDEWHARLLSTVPTLLHLLLRAEAHRAA